jgi:hypothetical protein
MALLRWWRERNASARRSATYASSLLAEPADGDVEWLARHGTAGDVDHARWELRYARRALHLLSAERDALDDRTASDVARLLSELVRRDPHVAPERREIAQQQFNVRLKAYGDVLARREGGGPTGAALGRTLLRFAGRPEPGAEEIARGGELLASYLVAANDALREAFGVASLPENVPPSAAVRQAR